MGTQSGKKPKQFYFNKVGVAAKFASTSLKFGYDASVQESYDDDLLNLIQEWESQGYVEIYDKSIHGYKASFPLAKDSNSVYGSSPDYTGLYHARLQDNDDDDPLVIVTFQGVIIDQQKYETAVIEAMIYHDLMFLPKGQKTLNALKARREWVRATLDNDD